MTSETPRTDAELIRMAGDQCDGLYVSPDFARELERENAQLRDALGEAIGLCDVPEHCQDSEWYEKRDALAALLANAEISHDRERKI